MQINKYKSIFGFFYAGLKLGSIEDNQLDGAEKHGNHHQQDNN